MLMNLLLFILKAIITLDTSGRDVLECDVCFMCSYLWNREKNNYYCTFCFIWIHIYSAKLIIPRWLPFQPFFLFLLLQLTYALLPAIRKKRREQKAITHPAKCTLTPTYTHTYGESYLITILLIVQPVGVAIGGGGGKESKRASFRENEREGGRGQAGNQNRH